MKPAFALCVALLGLWSSPAAAVPPRAFALVVGYNGSLDPETAELHYADDDAVLYAELFAELGAEVSLLVELDAASATLHPRLPAHGTPTRAALDQAVTAISAAMRAVDPSVPKAFYFVYAGHGDVQHGEGTITLADGPLSRTEFLTQVLDRVEADVKHVVIDACNSYFLIFGRGAGEERAPYQGPFVEEGALSLRRNTGLLLSTSSSQNSHEWEAFQAGVFSHEVRSALRGAADLNRDGIIQYRELAGFVETANRAIPNEKYRPRFLAVPPAGQEAFLEPLEQPTRRFTFDRKTSHHYFVEDEDGIRIADLRPGTDSVALLLPPGRDLFVHDLDQDAEYLLARKGPRRLSALRPSSPRAGVRGAAHEAFRKLFLLPFDEQAYAQSAESKALVLRRQPSEAIEPPAQNRALSPLFVGGIGTTAVLGSLSGTFYLMASRSFDQFKRASAAEQPHLKRETERFDRYALLSLSAAGISAAVTATLYLLGSWREE